MYEEVWKVHVHPIILHAADYKIENVITQGTKISVIFEPSSELNSRLNDEPEFRFVEVPTDEGKQDTDDNEEPTNDSGNETSLNDNDGF